MICGVVSGDILVEVASGESFCDTSGEIFLGEFWVGIVGEFWIKSGVDA